MHGQRENWCDYLIIMVIFNRLLPYIFGLLLFRKELFNSNLHLQHTFRKENSKQHVIHNDILSFIV